MTDDKKLNVVSNVLLIFLAVVIVWYVIKNTEDKHIDWPEEIMAAEVGDVLIVEKVDSQTITIGFKTK